MGGSSSKQVVGYKYYLGVHMALAHGPFDSISKIEVDRRVAWEGFSTGGTITVDAPTLFGGDKREGGVSGDVDIEMGLPSQTENSYLQSQLGTDIPAFRGVACAVLNQCYMGNNPYLKPWSFQAQRIELTSDGSEQWYIEAATIGRPEEEGGSPTCRSLSQEYSNLTFASQPANKAAVFGPLGYDLPTSSEFGQNGVSYVQTDQPPHSDNGIDDDWVLQFEFSNTGQYLSDNDPSATGTALNHSGGAIFAARDLFSLDGITTLVSKTVNLVYDSGSNLDREDNLHMDIFLDVDLASDRARFRLRIFDTLTYSGSDIVSGPYFDFDADGADENKWNSANWYFDIDPLSVVNELYEVNEFVSRNRIRYTYRMYICMKHWVNGGETEDSFGFTLSASSTQGWVNECTNFRYTEDQTIRYFENFSGQIAHLGSNDEGLTLDGNDDPLPACSEVSLYDCTDGSCNDMNPAHIVYECLTDAVWGMGYPSSDIDETAFQAAADTLLSENMGMSILWERETAIEDFIAEILRHIDAVLYVSRATGQFVLKLIRSETPTITLDESNVASVTDANRPTIDELTNSVNIVYWDAQTDEKASLSLHNGALRQIQGDDISTTAEYPGFTNRALANRIAERDLKAVSSSLLSCTVVASRTAAALSLGDPFYLNWPDLGISNVVMRANEIDYGDGIDNSVKITAVQDVFSTPSSSSQSLPSEVWIDPSETTPAAAVARVVMETPYYTLITEIGEREAGDILTDDADAGFLLASGGRAGSEFNADVLVDAGAGYEDSATLDFHPYAELSADITETTTVITIQNDKDLDLATTGTIAQIGDELVRVDALTVDGSGNFVSITVGRGILDTPPKKHLTGASISLWGEFATSDDEQYAASEVVNVKMLTTAGVNILAEGDAPVDSVTMNSRAIRPYAPGNLQVDASSYPASIEWDGDHDFTWAHRDRLQQTDGTLYDHTEGNIGPEAGTTYRVEGYAYNAASPVVETKFIDHNVGNVTSWTFDAAEVAAEAGVSDPPTDTVRILIRVFAVRDSYDSFQYAELEMQNTPP